MLSVEQYDNIYKFVEVINSRPDNGCFGDSSKDTDYGFRGTRTWDEAIEQFENGIPERAEALKKAVNEMRIKTDLELNKTTRRNYYYGYTPNVPNAIIGLPKSMRQIQRTPQKVKAINLIWSPVVNCGVDQEDIQKSGELVLQMIYTLEVKGYRVNLTSAPFAGREDGETIICMVTLKEFRQPLDMLKLSFPMTSPSYFRRLGFRWGETHPECKNKGWKYGYGRPLKKEQIIENLTKSGISTKDTFIISVDDCQRNGYNLKAVAKELGISL